MAFCTQCGHRAEEGARFCTQCGAPLRPVAELGDAPENKVQEQAEQNVA